ncbi:MAG TPA: alpha/beta hydrolase [Hyphomicrobiaceae bacterium]|jgi:pimeloyl-ACP methyl ester carboxylesterase|nr:alpha/beta hydrolase [Hyphomicrobiaceae bacterium]
MSFVAIDGRCIEYAAIPGDAGSTPTLVFLHEGLGSVALWRDFPRKVARRLNAPALVYSRFGYGASDGLLGKRTPRFMHEEALGVLPALLHQLGVERPVLVGHSDGASIALIHAAASARPVRALVCLAPHVFVEPVCVESIAKIRQSYLNTDLRQRLEKYHERVDDAFLGWADIWLEPEFLAWSIENLVARIKEPLLLIQGRDDEYGTLAQLDRIEARVKGPTTRLVLSACGHSPHRDQEAAVIDAIAAFVARLP